MSPREKQKRVLFDKVLSGKRGLGHWARKLSPAVWFLLWLGKQELVHLCYLNWFYIREICDPLLDRKYPTDHEYWLRAWVRVATTVSLCCLGVEMIPSSHRSPISTVHLDWKHEKKNKSKGSHMSNLVPPSLTNHPESLGPSVQSTFQSWNKCVFKAEKATQYIATQNP